MLFSLRALDVVLAPHLGEVIDAIDAGEHFHLGAHLGVRVLRIAVGERRVPAGERGKRAEIAAGGMAEHADAVRRDVEVLGIAANELDARQHVLHRMRKRLLPGLGER